MVHLVGFDSLLTARLGLFEAAVPELAAAGGVAAAEAAGAVTEVAEFVEAAAAEAARCFSARSLSSALILMVIGEGETAP